MKSGRELVQKWAASNGGYFEYCPVAKLKILDFIIRSKDLTITRANQVATNTYEVFNALMWFEDLLIENHKKKYQLVDSEINEEGWFYMVYENFEEKFGIKKDVVKNAVKILNLMGWVETAARFEIFEGQPRKIIHYRIIQSKIATDAGIEK